MKSFFSSIRNYFAGTFAGRYDEIILREVSRECPAVMQALYNNYNPSKHEIKLEYVYKKGKRAQKGKGGKKGRRADIAILEGKRVCCLMEIKVCDSPLKRQLNDYIRYSKKNNVEFIYLTRYKPLEDELRLFENVASSKSLLFSDLYNFIKKDEKVNNNAIGKLYLKYLEDTGNMFLDVSNVGVEKFLTRMFLPWGGNKRIRNTKDMVETIPSAFKNMMNNLNFINQCIGRNIDCQMTIDYAVFPYVKKNSDENYDSDKVCRDTRKSKAGGDLYLYASGSFAGKNSVVLEYGLYLKADSKKKIRFKYSLYAGVFLKGTAVENAYKEVKIGKTKLSDGNYCIEKLTELTKNVLEPCLGNKDLKHVKKKIKNSLEMLNA